MNDPYLSGPVIERFQEENRREAFTQRGDTSSAGGNTLFGVETKSRSTYHRAYKPLSFPMENPFAN
ncbi:MAG: hypothetical protein V7700_16430 [Halioglobus sp.]